MSVDGQIAYTSSPSPPGGRAAYPGWLSCREIEVFCGADRQSCNGGQQCFTTEHQKRHSDQFTERFNISS